MHRACYTARSCASHRRRAFCRTRKTCADAPTRPSQATLRVATVFLAHELKTGDSLENDTGRWNETNEIGYKEKRDRIQSKTHLSPQKKIIRIQLLQISSTNQRPTLTFWTNQSSRFCPIRRRVCEGPPNSPFSNTASPRIMV